MAENQTQRVFAEYEKRKMSGKLSPNLKTPTPGGLREECLNVYKEKGLPKEDPVLRSFFGPLNNEIDYVRRIENFDIDKFRPLVNFINQKTTTPNTRIVELLEWLMPKEENSATPIVPPIVPPINPGDNNDSGQGGHTIEEGPQSHFVRNILIGAISVIIFGGGIGIYREQIASALNYKSVFTENCMYWNGTRYEPIDCKTKMSGVSIVKMNTNRLNRFEKITEPDTLTQNSIGKIWYSSFMHNKEYFTDSGTHPIDTLRALRPVSSLVLPRYLPNKNYMTKPVYWSGGIFLFIVCCFLSVKAFEKNPKKELPEKENC